MPRFSLCAALSAVLLLLAASTHAQASFPTRCDSVKVAPGEISLGFRLDDATIHYLDGLGESSFAHAYLMDRVLKDTPEDHPLRTKVERFRRLPSATNPPCYASLVEHLRHEDALEEGRLQLRDRLTQANVTVPSLLSLSVDPARSLTELVNVVGAIIAGVRKDAGKLPTLVQNAADALAELDEATQQKAAAVDQLRAAAVDLLRAREAALEALRDAPGMLECPPRADSGDVSVDSLTRHACRPVWKAEGVVEAGGTDTTQAARRLVGAMQKVRSARDSLASELVEALNKEKSPIRSEAQLIAARARADARASSDPDEPPPPLAAAAAPLPPNVWWALTDFLVDRAQEEVVLAYLGNVREWIRKDHRYLAYLFPSTNRLLDAGDFTLTLPTWRQTFREDLRGLPERLPSDSVVVSFVEAAMEREGRPSPRAEAELYYELRVRPSADAFRALRTVVQNVRDGQTPFEAFRDPSTLGPLLAWGPSVPADTLRRWLTARAPEAAGYLAGMDFWSEADRLVAPDELRRLIEAALPDSVWERRRVAETLAGLFNLGALRERLARAVVDDLAGSSLGRVLTPGLAARPDWGRIAASMDQVIREGRRDVLIRAFNAWTDAAECPQEFCTGTDAAAVRDALGRAKQELERRWEDGASVTDGVLQAYLRSRASDLLADAVRKTLAERVPSPLQGVSKVVAIVANDLLAQGMGALTAPDTTRLPGYLLALRQFDRVPRQHADLYAKLIARRAGLDLVAATASVSEVADRWRGFEARTRRLIGQFESAYAQLRDRGEGTAATPGTYVGAVLGVADQALDLYAFLQPAQPDRLDILRQRVRRVTTLYQALYGGAYSTALTEAVLTLQEFAPVPLPDQATRVLTLASAVSTARTEQEMRAAFRASAMPAGGYRGKRSGQGGPFALNAYLGPTLARNYTDFGGGYQGAGLGPTLTLGADFRLAHVDRARWPFLGKIWLVNWLFPDGRTPWVGLHVPALDLGALGYYRLSTPEAPSEDGSATEGAPKTELERRPEATWAQLFAPGLYLVTGRQANPFTFGIGGQLNPALRKLDPNDEPTNATVQSFRIGFFLALDLTLLQF